MSISRWWPMALVTARGYQDNTELLRQFMRMLRAATRGGSRG